MAKARFKYPSIVRKLRKEAKDYYRLIYEEQVKGSDYLKFDDTIIVILCIEIHTYLNNVDTLLEYGDTFIGSRGDIKPHPSVGIKKSSYTNIKSSMNQLGVSPEARMQFAKLKGEGSGKSKSKKASAGISVVK